MIVVEVRPSRLQVIFLVALHLAAAFSFLLGLDAGLFGGLAAMLVAVSLFRSIARAQRGLPMMLGLGDDGGLVLRAGGEDELQELQALADGASVVLRQALWLAWRERQGRRRGVLVLLEDQLAPADWRHLQVWARLRARPEAGVARS